MSKMYMRAFEQTWETAYICERVKRITKDVENGNYVSALDYLNMIQEKAKSAEYQIRKLQAAE
jgi:pterin-4a-carbinolamine dehydratase